MVPLPVGDAVEPKPLESGRCSMVERGGVRVPGWGTTGREAGGCCCWSVYRGTRIFSVSLVRDRRKIRRNLYTDQMKKIIFSSAQSAYRMWATKLPRAHKNPLTFPKNPTQIPPQNTTQIPQKTTQIPPKNTLKLPKKPLKFLQKSHSWAQLT